jgi:uncharacterized repeat protein (TIGR03803 family)
LRQRGANLLNVALERDTLRRVFKGEAGMLRQNRVTVRAALPRGASQKRVIASLACALAAAGTASAQPQYKESVFHYFEAPPRGAVPWAGVIRDAAGNLYGTTPVGGAANAGVVYKVDPSGRQTVLYSFTGGADGGAPYAGVSADSAGNLYGTTYSGGLFSGPISHGVVYKVDTAGQETVLYSFTGGSDGSSPRAGVILDPSGNLYGATTLGGLYEAGVVYKLDTAGQETILHNFAGGDDGANPFAGVTRDLAGNLYGTTQSGGSAGFGTVYKLDMAGNETVLHAFTGGDDGGEPWSGVILDPAGSLYGTTFTGGQWHAGLIYKLNSVGQERVLYSFFGGAEGGGPYAGVVRDSAGNLYGTTWNGGEEGYGVVYRVNTAGTEGALHSFSRLNDGANPSSGVTLDSSGNLYGTTSAGGAAGEGVVYKVDTALLETITYNFPGGLKGSLPYSRLIRDPAGNLYGTTIAGGFANVGVVYKMDPAGRETVLYSFTGGTDGMYPSSGVILDPAGNLYGTTTDGGLWNLGAVYKLDPDGDQTVLYSFTYGTDGQHPSGGLIRDSAGNLYGTTDGGGAANAGTVFEVSAAGEEIVLYYFSSLDDGAYPDAGLIRDAAGNLYGTTSGGGSFRLGTVFKLDASGHETVLFNFEGPNGCNPSGGVAQDAAGNLYGITQSGGGANLGVVYKLDTVGQETVLHAFAGYPDGYGPSGAVALDSEGSLYGTTSDGGMTGYGTVYMVDPSGGETVLYSFTGQTDGGRPYAGVSRDSAGNLWGTASYDGAGSNGLVFKLVPQPGVDMIVDAAR